jgi:DNA repair photolyase
MEQGTDAPSSLPTSVPARERVRWRPLDDEVVLPGFQQRVTHPEFAGMEFVHVRAKSLLNHVPAAAVLPFEWTINVYRGCSHACSYCLAPDTPVLLADGRHRPIGDLRPGDRILGTRKDGRYRRYLETEVQDVWRTVKRAYRVRLADGTELVASADHRFLTGRGWKHVTGAGCGNGQRPHLTTNDACMGVGGFSERPEENEKYVTGYLCGMIRGDANLGDYPLRRRNGRVDRVYRFRLALADGEALERSGEYLRRAGVSTTLFEFSPQTDNHREIWALRTSKRADIERLRELISWPAEPSESWARGYLAGLFDAEGSGATGVMRFHNTDEAILDHLRICLDLFAFEHTTEMRPGACTTVRLLGGLRERLRFFHLTEPAIRRKLVMAGMALKSDADLRVVSVEDLGVDIPMVDITTGTGDFIANGVVSHNCFARPTHAWLELDADRDFERVIVVKVNAVERLRAELCRPSWRGEHVALGTNTDPYQRAEGRYRLTRGVVATLAEAGNPFSVLTKGTLVTRDLDILAEAARRGVCTGVSLSIPTLDEDVWRLTESGAPHPAARLQTVAALRDAGIPSGVMLAPIIPGLSDDESQLRAVIAGALEAGATAITPIVLHLRPGVREVFLPRLRADHPELAGRLAATYRGANAPADARRRIVRMVRRIVDELGGPNRSARHVDDAIERRRAARTGVTERMRVIEDSKGGEQLALL